MAYREHEEEYKGHLIEVYQGECPDDPRSWGQSDILVTARGDNELKGFESTGVSMEADIQKLKDEYDAWVVLPVWKYEHSGICLEAGEANPFNDPWDSGLYGFIYLTRDGAVGTFGRDCTSDEAAEYLNGQIETYNKYINGEVYRWVIDDGEDSCDGFYDLKEAIDDARSSVDYIVQIEAEEEAKKSKQPYFPSMVEELGLPVEEDVNVERGSK